MKPHNPNCDGDQCQHATGEVRVLPVGGDGNAILCRECWLHEMKFRKERNTALDAAAQFKLPAWNTLKVYGKD